MSVKRGVEDGKTDLGKLAPKRKAAFWPETTPTLGTTPTLPDDEAAAIAEAARRAARKAFGIVEPAPLVDPRDRSR